VTEEDDEAPKQASQWSNRDRNGDVLRRQSLALWSEAIEGSFLELR